MKNNKTEDIIAQINSNIFFKEFTFTQNDFKDVDSNLQLEFADSVVWLDDLLFIYQIKDRNANTGIDNLLKWYDNKVINKGVKQIKSTIKYLNTSTEISITNAKGHVLDISKARSCSCIKEIIIYTPDVDFPEEIRQKRFYNSSEIGLIHLFHSEDYYWICKYLITPAEINEYLDFREKFYLVDSHRSDLLPEQYILGHFLETLDVKEVSAHYINNLEKIDTDSENFDMSFLIEKFSDKITLNKNTTDYYNIIKEIAKLNRFELKAFKDRFNWSRDKCTLEDYQTPARMYATRTDCAFVFIPLPSSKAENWRIALENYTFSQKYDMKANKCIGLIMFKRPTAKKYFELYWMFVESPWIFNKEEEDILKENYPFRKVRIEEAQNRYKK